MLATDSTHIVIIASYSSFAGITKKWLAKLILLAAFIECAGSVHYKYNTTLTPTLCPYTDVERDFASSNYQPPAAAIVIELNDCQSRELNSVCPVDANTLIYYRARFSVIQSRVLYITSNVAMGLYNNEGRVPSRYYFSSSQNFPQNTTKRKLNFTEFFLDQPNLTPEERQQWLQKTYYYLPLPAGNSTVTEGSIEFCYKAKDNDDEYVPAIAFDLMPRPSCPITAEETILSQLSPSDKRIRVKTLKNCIKEELDVHCTKDGIVSLTYYKIDLKNVSSRIIRMNSVYSHLTFSLDPNTLPYRGSNEFLLSQLDTYDEVSKNISDFLVTNGKIVIEYNTKGTIYAIVTPAIPYIPARGTLELCDEGISSTSTTMEPHLIAVTTDGTNIPKSVIIGTSTGVGVFFILALAYFVGYFWSDWRQKKHPKPAHKKLPDHISDAVGRLRDYDVFLAKCFISNLRHPDDNLKIIGALAKGQHGVVVVGLYDFTKLSKRVSVKKSAEIYCQVAVKRSTYFRMFEDSAKLNTQSFRFLVEFVAEGQLLLMFNHPNVVRCFGFVLLGEHNHNQSFHWSGDSLQPALLMELLSDLKVHLKESNPPLIDDVKVGYGLQIADAMEYIHSKDVIHRDLALRNILVKPDLGLVKVADFGLSRHITHYYRADLPRMLPLKWMAPETVATKKFYPSSDVWSFGVTLWEILTNGSVPHEYADPHQLLDIVREGTYPGPQGNIEDNIYELLLSTWRKRHEDRPTFADLVTSLRSLCSGKTKNGIIYLDVVDDVQEKMQKPHVVDMRRQMILGPNDETSQEPIEVAYPTSYEMTTDWITPSSASSGEQVTTPTDDTMEYCYL